ncbi:MAG: pyrroloquinoline quinone biosynthesis peptide chaperone PqqD [Planctomycetes bacterium]|nr:pyrroloquinoline quinone biosynthesis peptide chaperone PqqD [Planctomycetota bacterium]
MPRGRKLAIKRGFRFQWEPAQDAFVLLYPEGMVKLGQSAGEILKRVDGASTAEQIVDGLKQQFPGADLEGDVYAFLDHAWGKGWLAAE